MASNGATGWGFSSCNAGHRDKPNAGDRDKAMRSETSAGFVVSVSHFMRFLGQPQGDFRSPSALFSKTWPQKAQITGHGAGTFFAHLSLRSRSPSHPAHLRPSPTWFERSPRVPGATAEWSECPHQETFGGNGVIYSRESMDINMHLIDKCWFILGNQCMEYLPVFEIDDTCGF